MFEVTIDDIPGKIHILTGIIARHRGNIHNIVHDRLSAGLSVGETRVIFTIETRGRDHLKEIMDGIRISGFTLKEIS
jgi:threonine dehydratase